MADKRTILLQLDSDPHASAFDAVVAVDAGASELLQYGGVTPENVRDLVYGAIFTRGPKDLHRTAIFIGGKNAGVGERILDAVTASFMGPLRCSVMLDANGANTTAAAAVLAARRHVALKGTEALVLGATGPVGQRAVRLLAREGARVRVGSRDRDRAVAVCDRVTAVVARASLQPVTTGTDAGLMNAVQRVALIIATGPPGVTLLPTAAQGTVWRFGPRIIGMPSGLDVPTTARSESIALKTVIDLNAVPPVGVEGIDVLDKGVEHDGVICYGAIGVGDTKMKIHKAAVASLFTANDRVLDAEQIYDVGDGLEKGV